MKVKLTFGERMIAFMVLSEGCDGTMSDWKGIDQGKMLLGLSEADRELYDVKKCEDAISWGNTEEGDKEKEYDLPEKACVLLKKEFKRMDKEGSIPSAGHASCAMKFLTESNE